MTDHLRGELPSKLSPRETEIVELMANGVCNHEIAARLFLSYQTVKNMQRTIYEKLKVHTEREAIAVYWKRKFDGRSGDGQHNTIASGA